MRLFFQGAIIKNIKGEGYPEFPDVPIDVYDWGINVNLKGPFYFSHAVQEHDNRAVSTQPTIKAAKAVRDHFDYLPDLIL